MTPVFRLITMVALLQSSLPAHAAPDGDLPGNLSGILEGLRDIEADMTVNQKRIDVLQGEIGQLQSLGKDAESEILRLQALVEAHAARVQGLADRYSQVLVLAEKLRRDLEWSSTINFILGGGVVLAVLVAVGEGLALAGK